MAVEQEPEVGETTYGELANGATAATTITEPPAALESAPAEVTPAEMEVAPAIEAPVSAWFPPPASAPAIPPARKRARRWVRVAIVIVLVLILGAGGGAYVANASLSAQYSPQRAAADYFAAQSRGDAATMMSNSTYLRGDGSYALYFGASAVTEMLALPQNRAITDVRIVKVEPVDELTSNVTVSMTWAGDHRTHVYSVKRDDTRVHDQFYYSWRVQIPFATVGLQLPLQAGALEVDNLLLPPEAPQTSIQVIEGYHAITMDGTAFYDSASQTADAVDGTPFLTFEGKVSATALKTAGDAVRAAFGNCDAAQNWECMNHVYHAPYKPGWVYFITMPGYGDIDYSTYVFSMRGDPAANMKVTVLPEFGQAAATGTCAVTMTIDGGRKYNFNGTWATTLIAGGSTFGADVLADCAAKKG